MTNAELIKALRETDFGYVCEHCEHEDMCRNNDCVIIQAADALEADEQQIVELQKQVNEFIKNETRSTVIKVMSKRIAELEAQLPKEGEWIEKWRFKTDGTPFHKIGDMECSVCHGDMLGRYYSKYCPHCGARMRGEHDGET